jgi:hypothetical protein
MIFNERLEAYSAQHARAGRPAMLDGPEAKTGYPWLTPAQRRRLNHKNHSAKTHSHVSLLLADADGNVTRQVCTRCNPPARRRQAVGGTR